MSERPTGQVTALLAVLLWIAGSAPTAGQPAGEDRFAEAQQRLSEIEQWILYDRLGQKLSAEQVIALVDEAGNDRLGTVAANRLKRVRDVAEALLAAEQRPESGPLNPYAVTAPSLAVQREQKRRRIRDLERRLAACHAVQSCFDSSDCGAIRSIEADRAAWRASGDPLPRGPGVPGPEDMREILEAALRRHRSTLEAHLDDLVRLQQDCERASRSRADFVSAEEALQGHRRTLEKTRSDLHDRCLKADEMCQQIGRASEKAASEARATQDLRASVDRQLAAGRAAAAACRGAADADAIEQAYRQATAALGELRQRAEAAERELTAARDALSRVAAEVSAVDQGKLHASAVGTQALSEHGQAASALRSLASVLESLAAAKDRVKEIVDSLGSLGDLDAEAASWEKALSDDAALAARAQREYADLRTQYAALRDRALRAIADADGIVASAGDANRAATALGEDGLAAARLDDAIRALACASCAQPSTPAVPGLAGVARSAADAVAAGAHLLNDARACRAQAQTGASTGASPPPASTSPAGGSTSTPGAPAESSFYGGLLIRGPGGRTAPREIAVGATAVLRGMDHGRRPYPSVEWVCSNQEVLTLGADGSVVGRRPGFATVMAKVEGMVAFHDIMVLESTASLSSTGGMSGGTDASTGSAGDAGGSGPTPTPPTAEPPGGDFGDGGPTTVEVVPLDLGLLGTGPGSPPRPLVPETVPGDEQRHSAQSLFSSQYQGPPADPAVSERNERCERVAGPLTAAAQANDIPGFRALLAEASDCNFYPRALGDLQRMEQAAQQRCLDLAAALDAARNAGDLPRFRSLLPQAQGCVFYDQAAADLRNAERSQRFSQTMQGLLGVLQQMQRSQNRGSEAPPRATLPAPAGVPPVRDSRRWLVWHDCAGPSFACVLRLEASTPQELQRKSRRVTILGNYGSEQEARRATCGKISNIRAGGQFAGGTLGTINGGTYVVARFVTWDNRQKKYGCRP